MTDVFAVFEGGGVKGIAHVGALARFHEEESLRFKGYAGTSAGAIVAALAAVGYSARNPSSLTRSVTPQDINMIMEQLDFEKLLGDSPVPISELHASVESLRLAIPQLLEVTEALQKLASAGRTRRLWKGGKLLQKYQMELKKLQELPKLLQRFSVNRGIYETGKLVSWLREYLSHSRPRSALSGRGGRLTFHSLREANSTILKVVATDLMDPRPRVFGPDDSSNMEVALAVQASISIPLFFCPYIEGSSSSMLVDGGLRSNYPVWIFDKERQQNGVLLPIVGFRLKQERAEDQNQSLEDYIWRLVNAALEGASWLEERDMKRVVEVLTIIPADVRATSFDLNKDKKENLFHRGYETANEVLKVPENREILGLEPTSKPRR